MTEDQRLKSEIVKKNQKAFRVLVEKYGGLIKAIVRRHLKSTPYEDECINDCLFALWQNMNRFDPEKNSLKNWIAAVCKYKCIDYLRLYYHNSALVPLTEDIPVQDSPDAKELIEELLAELKPEDRELFRRHYIDGVPVTEIALQNGKSSDFLYNRLSLGRKKLRNKFSKEKNI